ncbi:hypothetical protein [Pseudonocardia xishanensis]|uniref:Uncharacterized protein n=1 Tax=Pseudonocardia xishanensis TaxID=630995 RepID=A0ABP8RP51_9PSEU
MAAGAGDWTGSFLRSPLAPTVFETAPAVRPVLRAWLAEQVGARAETREPLRPAVDAWAVLDGGVLAVAHCRPAGPQDLPAGLHVVGFGAFRLVTAELGLARPLRPVPGEPLYDLDSLRRAHRARPAECPDAREQAELLATCVDARSLRWVAGALAAVRTPGEASALGA